MSEYLKIKHNSQNSKKAFQFIEKINIEEIEPLSIGITALKPQDKSF
jgi:hypothetical protein